MIKRIYVTLFLSISIIITTHAADVTGSIVNLGNTHDQAGSSDKGGDANTRAIGFYKNRIYIGRSKDGVTPDVVFYDVDTGTFDVIRKRDGTRFDNLQEKILRFQVSDNNLLICAEDGHPNNKGGFMTDDVASGWILVDLPGDQAHNLNQYRFQGYYFSTVNAGFSPISSGVPFIRFDSEFSPYVRGADISGEFAAERCFSRNFFELWGHLFADGYVSLSTGAVINANSLVHYAGIVTNGWEVVYDRSKDLHTTLDSNFGMILNQGFSHGERAIIRSLNNVIRASKGTRAGASGEYPIPVGQARISAKASDILYKYGHSYIAEVDSGIATIKTSSDLLNWSTLATFSTGITNLVIDIAGDNIYFSGNQNLYTISGSAFGGLPKANNIAPIALNDNYFFAVGDPSLVYRGTLGLLGNDSDGNGDVLYITEHTTPSNGTIELEKNGTFNYTPAAGFSGIASFTYRVSDGAQSSNTATVRITVGSGDNNGMTPYEQLSSSFNWGNTPHSKRNASDDANGNGISNLMEFAFNMSPTASGKTVTLTPGTGTSGLPATSVITPATPTLRTEYLRRKNSRLNYKLRFSDDLATWVDAVASPTVTSINSDWERVVMQDTAGSGRKKRFSRVEVSEAP